MQAKRICLMLLSGILIPIIFWASTIAAAFIHGDYNHLQNTISQLGAVGTKSESFMTAATWTCVVLSVSFFVGLLKTCSLNKLSVLPLTGILGFTVTFGWAAMFHAGNSLHSKGGAAVILLFMGPLLSIILWRGKDLKILRILSLVSLSFMLLILLRAVIAPNFESNYIGLMQRFTHLGWSVWFTSLSLIFFSRSGKSLRS